MARKTKRIAATKAATTASVTDIAANKPRNRRAATARVARRPVAAKDSCGHASDGKPAAKPIAGKLGLIAEAVAKPKGISLEDLVKVTGWQPHTVRAALTRLRQRSIAVKLTMIEDRKVYRVVEAGA